MDDREQRESTADGEVGGGLFCSAEFAAEQLGCSRREIYYRLDSGRLDGAKDGRRRLVLRSSLKAYIGRLLEQTRSGSGA